MKNGVLLFLVTYIAYIFPIFYFPNGKLDNK